MQVAVLGSLSLIVLNTVSVDVKQHGTGTPHSVLRVKELCESGGGRPGLPVPNNPYCFCGCKVTLNCSISEFRSCMKVEVAVLGSPPLTVRTVSVDVKQR